MDYAEHVSKKTTPQSEPIPGTVANSAGGYSFAVDDWKRLDRLLVLGTEGGSYYASDRELTRENAAVVERLLKVDGLRVVARIAEISDAGRAPKNDPAIFALALALKTGDEKTRRAARVAVPKVCRIGTHIFQLAQAVKHLGGWGRATKGAFADWYLQQDGERLAMNLVKYQQRGGWSHRDLLRKAHVRPNAPWQSALFRWAVGKPNDAPVGGIIGAFEAAKNLIAGSATDTVQAGVVPALAKLISTTGLPRECVPTAYLNSPDIWDALLRSGKHGMPLTAMVRNLGKMSAIGLLKPLSDVTRFVCNKLEDREALKAARVHPVQLLLALATYRQGHGDKGKLSWEVSTEVCAALDAAFYSAFEFVEPTGKRYLLALDVSGSMAQGNVAGTSLTPREAAAAMALVTTRTEQRCHVVGFTSAGHSGGGFGFLGGRATYGGQWDSGRAELTPIADINARASLTDAVRAVSNLPFGGTDCALPMIYAEQNKLEVDTFIVYTDSETWAGAVHPVQALRSYRQKTGINAKLIVCGMVANEFTIADPTDPGMLDVVGFDANCPALMADFVRG